MEDLQYVPCIVDKRHIITLKDIFSYYDVTKLIGEGNLRITYGRKDKRDLVVSIFNVYIAEMFDVFAEGGIVFNFPGYKEAKLMFEEMPKDYVKKAKANGKLKMLDPLASNFKSVGAVIKIATLKSFYKIPVSISKNYQKKVYDNLNKGKSMLNKKNKYWDDFMEPVYNTFPTITKESLNKVISFGLRKIIFFLTKTLEVFFTNTTSKDFLYFGRGTNKIEDFKLRQKYLKKQYIKKLRWHDQAKKEKSSFSYYTLTEELYQKHLAKEPLDKVMVHKIKEECLLGASWMPYVFKTVKKSHSYTSMRKDYDSSNDELIFIKPVK